MRSANKDPFASTSQALGRAKDRRTNRTSSSGRSGRSGRRGLEEQDDDGERHHQESSERRSGKQRNANDSGSEPPTIPTRGSAKQRGSTAASPSTIPGPNRRKSTTKAETVRQDESLTTIPAKSRRSKSTTSALDHVGSMAGPKALDTLPSTFQNNPKQADPVLFYLPRLINSEDKDDEGMLDLKTLLQAAQDDVRLHRGRVQAGVKKGTFLSFSSPNDYFWKMGYNPVFRSLTRIQSGLVPGSL